MSAPLVELALQVFDAITRRDLEFLISSTDPEVEWHSFFAVLARRGIYRGHDGMARYVSDLHEAWEIVGPQVDDSLAVGNVALLVGRVHYRGKTSGVETDQEAGWVLTFRNGKVLTFRAFREPEQVLAGVRPAH